MVPRATEVDDCGGGRAASSSVEGASGGDALDRLVRVGAVLSFVVAGLAGLLYRWGLVGGFPAGLIPGDIRHAHSHLMMLGWLTPALFLLMRRFLVRETGVAAPRVLDGLALVAVVLSWGMFPAFLFHGYRPVSIGSASIPLGAASSGLGVFVWYAWIAVWVRTTWGLPRTRALHFWDASLFLLVVASIGGWAQMAFTLLKVRHPFWHHATIHLFVDVFSDGWLLAAFLGVAWSVLRPRAGGGALSTVLLLLAMPTLFLLSTPQEHTPWSLRWTGSVGAVVVGSVLLGQAFALVRSGSAGLTGLAVPVGLLFVKAGLMLALAVPAIAAWGESNGLRILYLHVGFVGILTAGVFSRPVGMVDGGRWLGAWSSLSALVLLATLLPLTGLWPSSLAGRWVLQAAFWGSVPMVVAGVAALGALLRPRATGVSTTADAVGAGAVECR